MKMTEIPLQFLNKGEKLFGILHLPRSKGKFPCVVMFHGLTGNRSEAHYIFTKTARRLASLGIAAFRFDFRGSGDSEGKFENMSIATEISDAKEALKFIKKHKNIKSDDIGILGLSMGGFVAASTCGITPGVKSTVLWSAVASYRMQYEKQFGKNFTVKDFPVKKDFGGLVVKRKYYIAALNSNDLPRESLGKFKGPLLIVHSDNDDNVLPVSARIHYKASASEQKVLKIIKGGGHTFADANIEPKVIELTAKWFKRTL